MGRRISFAKTLRIASHYIISAFEGRRISFRPEIGFSPDFPVEMCNFSDFLGRHFLRFGSSFSAFCVRLGRHFLRFLQEFIVKNHRVIFSSD